MNLTGILLFIWYLLASTCILTSEKHSRISFYAKKDPVFLGLSNFSVAILQINRVSKLQCGFRCLKHPLCQSFSYQSQICSLQRRLNEHSGKNQIDFFGPVSEQPLHCFEMGVEISSGHVNDSRDPCNMQYRVSDLANGLDFETTTEIEKKTTSVTSTADTTAAFETSSLTTMENVSWSDWSDWGPYVADFCYGYGLIGMAVYSNISHLIWVFTS